MDTDNPLPIGQKEHLVVEDLPLQKETVRLLRSIAERLDKGRLAVTGTESELEHECVLFEEENRLIDELEQDTVANASASDGGIGWTIDRRTRSFYRKLIASDYADRSFFVLWDGVSKGIAKITGGLVYLLMRYTFVELIKTLRKGKNSGTTSEPGTMRQMDDALVSPLAIGGMLLVRTILDLPGVPLGLVGRLYSRKFRSNKYTERLQSSIASEVVEYLCRERVRYHDMSRPDRERWRIIQNVSGDEVGIVPSDPSTPHFPIRAPSEIEPDMLNLSAPSESSDWFRRGLLLEAVDGCRCSHNTPTDRDASLSLLRLGSYAVGMQVRLNMLHERGIRFYKGDHWNSFIYEWAPGKRLPPVVEDAIDRLESLLCVYILQQRTCRAGYQHKSGALTRELWRIVGEEVHRACPVDFLRWMLVDMKEKTRAKSEKLTSLISPAVERAITEVLRKNPAYWS